MTKKRLGTDPFKPTGVDALIRDTRGKQSKQSKQRLLEKQKCVITKTSQEGLKEGWTRATFIMREHLLEKLKAQAYWERIEIKELINTIFSSYFKSSKIKSRKKGGV